MNKFTCLLSFTFYLLSCFALQAQSLSSRLDSIMVEAEKEHYFTGLAVYDLIADSMLYAYNADKRMRPASTQKVMTAVAALDILGAQHKYETRAYYAGHIGADSTLYGDIYVVGGFDPAYSYDDLRTLAYHIRKLGINRIAGGIIGDVSMKDTMTMGNGWCWDDVPSEVEAYLSPLTFNRGCATVEINGGRAVFSVPTTYMTLTDSTRPFVSKRTATRLTLTRNWVDNGNHFTVRGTARNNTVSRPISVYRPERYFACTLTDVLRGDGVVVEQPYAIGALPDSVFQPFYISARTVEQILQQMMKDSDNLYAESMFYQLAYFGAGRGATWKDGAKQVENMMQRIGIPKDSYRIADGSGVSLYNYITPAAEVAVLRHAYSRENIRPYLYASLPVAGIDGTLEERMRKSPARMNVRAKTGTVSGVSCLSGYCQAANGNVLAFVIMNNGQQRASLARTLQDRLCEEMVR